MSTYEKQEPDGRVVELPMLRDEAGGEPPCHVCPKIPKGQPASWDHAIEFEPWLWDVIRWFDGWRAVGDFGRPSGFMRDAAAVLHAFAERRQAKAVAEALGAALLCAILPKG